MQAYVHQQEYSLWAPFLWRLVNFPWSRARTESMGTDVGIVYDQHGSECQVSLSGRITIDSSPGLQVLLLKRLQSPGCQSLTLDFYDVAYIDTSGLAMLVEILKAARDQGKTFHLSRLRERPRYFLEATRLLHLFEDSNLSEASNPNEDPDQQGRPVSGPSGG